MKLNIQEIWTIINALELYKRSKDISNEEYFNANDLYFRVIKEQTKKIQNWYLVIRGSRSWYSWQNNCYKWERWSKAIKMKYNKAKEYLWSYEQFFNDWTRNYWKVSFEHDKPQTNNSLWDYERWLRKQWLPV